VQFKPGKAKKVQTIRNILTGKMKLGNQQQIKLLLTDDLEVYLNGQSEDKKKLMTTSFMRIGRMSQACTLLKLLLKWMRPVWILTLHRAPHYAGSENSL
jgi:hypothetical protein